jgi:hypothetical protein
MDLTRHELLAKTGKWILLTSAAETAWDYVLAGEAEASPNYDMTKQWWAMIIAVDKGIGWGAAAFFRSAHYWPLAFAAALVYSAMSLDRAHKAESVVQRILSALVTGLLARSLYGMTNASLTGPHIDASFASTLRTVLVSVIAIALGWFGKSYGADLGPRSLDDMLRNCSPKISAKAVRRHCSCLCWCTAKP